MSIYAKITYKGRHANNNSTRMFIQFHISRRVFIQENLLKNYQNLVGLIIYDSTGSISRTKDQATLSISFI